MKIETEFRYVGFDLDKMLTKAKALSRPKVLRFKRAVFDIPNRDGWLRLRTDGKQTTLTAKVNSAEKSSESYESEVLISSFEDGLALLSILGYNPRSVQNNIRIVFDAVDCAISIDLWPGISPVMEIEGKTEKAIENVEARFNDLRPFRTQKTVTELYEDEGIDIKHVQNLDFESLPSILEALQ